MPIDLNADLGESFGHWKLGDDERLVEHLTSANVACGFHAGDPATLLETCRRAVARGVVIGAQVGYPDLAGFGRRFLDMSPADLTAAVIYQIGALDGLARAVGGAVRYVKPHGALYHACLDHDGQARAVVEAVQAYDRQLPLVGMRGSALLRIARQRKIRQVTEYFVDRTYTADGRLVDRREPDALISDVEYAARRAVRAAQEGMADSFCTHGDTPEAVAMARAVRSALEDAGVAIRPFVENA